MNAPKKPPEFKLVRIVAPTKHRSPVAVGKHPVKQHLRKGIWVRTYARK